VQLLLEQKGVSADSKYSSGRTHLSWAAPEGNAEAAELLLKHEDVVADAKDNLGQTPLFFAAGFGHKKMVRLLLARADVAAQLKNCFGQTPLFWASGNGHQEVVKLLLEQADVCADAKDCSGQTPLFRAAVRGHAAVVARLLDQGGVSADSLDCFGHTPLVTAAGNGHNFVVTLLLDREDVAYDAKDDSNRTPLLWAAACGYEAIVKLLLDRIHAVSASKDGSGQCLRSCAADDRQETVAMRLLQGRKNAKAASQHRGRRSLYSGPPANKDMLLVREFFATEGKSPAKIGSEQTPRARAADVDSGTVPGQDGCFTSPAAPRHDAELRPDSRDQQTFDGDGRNPLGPGVDGGSLERLSGNSGQLREYRAEGYFCHDNNGAGADVQAPSYDATICEVAAAILLPLHDGLIPHGSGIEDMGSRRKRLYGTFRELEMEELLTVDSTLSDATIDSERLTKARRTREDNGSDEYRCSSTPGR
jgi:ankyrin repeat protein